jgi:hypothetical protein
MDRLILDSVCFHVRFAFRASRREKRQGCTSSPKQATKRKFLTWKRLHFAIFGISLSHSAKPVPKDRIALLTAELNFL